MAYKITGEYNKKYGTVNLSNLFVTEYMPGIGGNALKIYVLLLYYAKIGAKADEQSVANNLGMDLSYVSAGLIELESKGLISREGNELVLQDLVEKHIRDNYAPRTAPRPDNSESGDAPDRTHLLRAISDRFFGGQMSQSWYNDIVLWANTYDFCDEVVFMIFQQNKDKPYSRPYMKKVMEAYGERGIHTVEQMNNWLQRREVYVKVRSRVASNLKIDPLTVYQEKYIEKWFYEYGYGFDVIDIALKEAAGMNRPSFNLYDAMLTNWHDNGLETAEAVKAYVNSRKKASGNASGNSKGTGKKPSGNYDQRDYSQDFYDSIYGDGK
jgi:DnaD/phage-associated family protein